MSDDDLLDSVERDQIALEHVCAPNGVAQLVLQAAGHDLPLVIEIVANELQQRQRARHAVHERDGVVAEGRLQRRALVELVEDDLRHRLALELDLDPHAGLVGQVLDAGDLGEHVVLDELSDLPDHALVAALADAVGQLRHDNGCPAATKLFDVRACAHDDAAPAGAVRLADPLAAEDDRTGREIRPLDVLGQAVDIDRRLVDHRHDRVDDLSQVVGRHVGRHADGDSRRAVDEQVREPRGQHERLPARAVVVRAEVDRVGIDVAEQFCRDRRQAGLGIAVRSSRVAVDVAEVALWVDEGVAQGELLRHPHKGVVDRRVAVRMEALHHLADHR